MLPKIIRNLLTPDVSLYCEIEHNFTQKVEAFRKMPKLRAFASHLLSGTYCTTFSFNENDCEEYVIVYTVTVTSYDTPIHLTFRVNFKNAKYKASNITLCVAPSGDLLRFSAYPQFIEELPTVLEDFAADEYARFSHEEEEFSRVSLLDCHKET